MTDAALPPPLRVRKRYVTVPHGQVHLRVAGAGPPVVLLHDSPRSSVMHLPNLGWLGRRFTVYALDTPGYGRSTPLPAEPAPTIPDFAAALGHALGALGLERPAVYGFHTSSKIALALATLPGAPLGGAVLDGLSLPASPPPEAFIARYMQPFAVSGDGSHLASQWSKVLDFHRWFPWFSQTAATRLDMDLPDDDALHAYAMDTLMAGPAWSSAYAAAMRYPAREAIGRVRLPLTFTCRADDVLYAYLDALPDPLPPGSRRAPLAAGRDEWQRRLAEWFAEYAAPAAVPPPPDPLDEPGPQARRAYVDHADGQVHLRLAGEGPRPPLLMLHDLPGSAAALEPLAGVLATDRRVVAPDLPGCGESDALTTATATAYADALLGCLDRLRLDAVDLYAEHLAAPLAMELARRAPQRVRRIACDGLPPLQAAARAALLPDYCPSLAPRRDGTHWLAAWHLLGDREASWPWFDRRRSAARRRSPALDAATRQRVLVDLLRQPGRYADPLTAALAAPVAETLAALQTPVTVLVDAGDVRDAGVPQAVAGVPAVQCRSKPADRAEYAAALRACLDG